MPHFLFPITYTEYLDWYNRREKDFSGLRFIPVQVKGHDIDIHSQWEEALVDALPEYEEDFQVMIALVELKGIDKYRQLKIGESRPQAPKHQPVDILNLQRLYPITVRGERMLQTRLPEAVNLGPARFEDAIKEVDRKNRRSRSAAGGEALIEMFELTVHDGTVSNIREETLDAVAVKTMGEGKTESESIVSAVIAYDRHDKPEFPSSSLGFVYDYFLIINQRLQNLDEAEKEEIIQSVLYPARRRLDQLRNSANAIQALYDDELGEAFTELERSTALALDRCSPKSAILFLDLRSQLRRRDTLDAANIDQWVDRMRTEGDGKDLATGLWMLGAFFGFGTFAEDYYSWKRAPFMAKRKPA